MCGLHCLIMCEVYQHCMLCNNIYTYDNIFLKELTSCCRVMDHVDMPQNGYDG